MNKSTIIVLAVVGLIVGIGAIFGMSYVSAYNTANRLERELEAVWANNENILANYGQKISEAAQIPAMQTEDLQKLFTGSLEARYGKEGSKAAMQWIKEHNPNLDQQTYVQLMRMIEAGRNEFSAAQTKLVDVKRTYSTQLGSFWSGTWMGVAGYPRIDLAQYKPVTTARAADAFASGVEQPMKLR